MPYLGCGTALTELRALELWCACAAQRTTAESACAHKQPGGPQCAQTTPHPQLSAHEASMKARIDGTVH